MQRLSERLEQIQFRGPGFDRIRLIAAMTVVLHHCSTYVTDNIANDVLSQASGGLVNFGHLAVYVFFATSGALVAPGLLRSGDVTAFAVHRCVRVMPALFVVVVLTAFLVGPALTTLTLRQYFQDPLTFRYLNNIVFRMASYLPGVQTPEGSQIIVNGSLWTIYYEVLSYIALAMLFLVGALRNRKICASFFVFVYAANALLWWTDSLAGQVPERVATFIDLFVYFLAGACLFVFSDKIPYNPVVATVALVVAGLSLPLGAGVVLLPALISYVVIYVGYSGLLGRNPLKADYSYGVYLCHAVVLTTLLVAFPDLRSFLPAVCIVTVATLALAWVSWRFVEEPCLRGKKAASEAVRRALAALIPLHRSPSFVKGRPAMHVASSDLLEAVQVPHEQSQETGKT